MNCYENQNGFRYQSSSSSFVVELEVETADNARYVFETKPSEYGTDSNFICTGQDIAHAANIGDLCRLLQISMTGTGKTKIKAFTKELSEEIADLSAVQNVTLAIEFVLIKVSIQHSFYPCSVQALLMW